MASHMQPRLASLIVWCSTIVDNFETLAERRAEILFEQYLSLCPWNLCHSTKTRVNWKPGFQVHEDGIKSNTFPKSPKILGENKIK